MDRNLPITTHGRDLWTRWSEPLFPERSAKMIDGSKKRDCWLSRVHMLLKGAAMISSTQNVTSQPCLIERATYSNQTNIMMLFFFCYQLAEQSWRTGQTHAKTLLRAFGQLLHNISQHDPIMLCYVACIWPGLYTRFPALDAGCLFKLRVLIGSSHYWFIVIGQLSDQKPRALSIHNACNKIPHNPYFFSPLSSVY